MSIDFPLEKIISGGQTGADAAALDWAIANGLQHGGWCPKGRKCETGTIDLKYQLVETSTSGYLARTERNVIDSDATIIFTLSDQLAGGSLRTEGFARKHGKPCFHFRPGVDPKFIGSFVKRNQVRVLNAAGSRASTAEGIELLVLKAFDAAFPQSTAG